MFENSTSKKKHNSNSRERSRANKIQNQSQHKKKSIKTQNNKQDPFLYEVMNFRKTRTNRQKDRDKKLASHIVKIEIPTRNQQIQMAPQKDIIKQESNNQLKSCKKMNQEAKQYTIKEESKQRSSKFKNIDYKAKIPIFKLCNDLAIENLSRFLGKHEISLSLTKEQIKKDLRGLRINVFPDHLIGRCQEIKQVEVNQ